MGGWLGRQIQSSSYRIKGKKGENRVQKIAIQRPREQEVVDSLLRTPHCDEFQIDPSNLIHVMIYVGSSRLHEIQDRSVVSKGEWDWQRAYKWLESLWPFSGPASKDCRLVALGQIQPAENSSGLPDTCKSKKVWRLSLLTPGQQ